MNNDDFSFKPFYLPNSMKRDQPQKPNKTIKADGHIFDVFDRGVMICNKCGYYMLESEIGKIEISPCRKPA